MKKFWLVVLSFSLLVATSASATPSFPSVAGEWALEGTQKINGSMKGYGSGSQKEAFYGNASFNNDGILLLDSEYLGTWTQTKNKININVDTTDLEMMINEFIYDETGLEIYVDIVGATGMASLKKDNMRLTSGKLYIKYTISGDGVVGKGAYKVSFKGERSDVIAMMSAASFDEDKSNIVVSFGNMIIKDYLKKK